MAVLTTQTITDVAGTAITFASANAGGDKANRPGPKLYALVKNGDASSTTVTVVVPGTEWNGVAKPDTAITVAAGATKAIPLDARYANSSNQVDLTYSSVTSLTIAIVSV